MKMRLSDVLDNLAIGEFSQTAMAESGEFTVANINKIIVLLNAAITDISSRFWVKKKEVYIKTKKGQNTYVLEKSVPGNENRFGSCNPCGPNGDPFEDDLLQIYSITDEHGTEYWLNHDTSAAPSGSGGCTCQPVSQQTFNDMCECCKQKRYRATIDDVNTITTIHHPYGVPNQQPNYARTITLLAYNTLRIPEEAEGKTLKVVYRASGKRMRKIDVNLTPVYDVSRIEVDLPPAYLSAVLNYIASRKFNPNMNGVQNGFHEGNNYYQKYLAACALIQDQGFDVAPVGNEGSKFTNRGFV